MVQMVSNCATHHIFYSVSGGLKEKNITKFYEIHFLQKFSKDVCLLGGTVLALLLNLLEKTGQRATEELLHFLHFLGMFCDLSSLFYGFI